MWKGPGEDPGGPDDGSRGGARGAASQQELQDLKDQYEQQQTLIAQLKEMLRKTDQTTINQEKVAEYANTLTKMNARAKRGQQREGRDEARSGQSSRKGETPASEKVMLLRQQLEQNRVKLAERGKSQKGMEDMVTQIKAQLDDSQQHFNSTQTPLNISLIDDRVDYTPNTNSQELYNILLNKDKRISDLNGKVSRLEANVLDLQENIKEKDSVIDARTKAITLMSENLSKKGKTTLDTLDETKEQMRAMQENFIKMEEEMKVECSRLKSELEDKQREIEDLKIINERLTTSNTELLKHMESEPDDIDNSLISRLQERIYELEELKNKTIDESIAVHDNSLVQQLQQRISELEELSNRNVVDSQIETLHQRINELEELNKNVDDTLVQQLQQRINELEDITNKSESNESPQNSSKSRKSKKGKQQKQSDNVSVKISELENTIQERDTKIIECNKIIEGLQKELNTQENKQNIIDEKLKTIEELQSLNAELNEKIVVLENTVRQLKTSVQDINVGEEHPDVIKLRQQLEESNKNMIKVKALNKSKVKELNRKIDQFKKIGDLNAAVVRLETENSKYVQKIAELEEEKGQMQLNMVESKESINLDEVKDLEERLKEYLEEIANKNSRIATLEHNNEVNDTKISELLEKIEDLTYTQNAQIKSDLTSVQYEEQLEKLETEKKLITNEKEKLILENRNFVEQIEIVKKEKLDVANKLDSYMQENIELMDRLEKLSAEKVSSAESIEIVENLTQQEKLELEAYQKNLAIDDKTAESLNESVSQLTEETSELLQKIELFTVERREVMEKMEALTAENNQLNSKLKEIENNRDILAETYEQLQTEKEELDLRLENMEKTEGIEEYKTLIEIQKQEITELRLKVLSHENLHETNRVLLEKLSDLEKKFDNELIEDLTQKNHDFEVRNAELEQRMNDFEAKLRNNLEEIEAYKSAIEDGKNELVASSDLIGTLQEKLKEKTSEIEHYEDEVSHLSSVITELNSLVGVNDAKVDANMSAMSEQLESLKKSLNENLKIIEDYERELNQNSSTINDLNSNLKNLNNRTLQAEQSLEEKDDEITKIVEEKNALEETNQKLEKYILEKEKTFHTQCQELKNKCLGMQKQIETNSETFSSLQLKAQMLEQKNKEQFEKMKKIAANLKKKTSDYKELESKLEKEIMERMKFEKTSKPQENSEMLLQEKSKIIENLEIQYQEKIKTIESLEELLKEKSKVIENLENQVQENLHVIEILERQLQEKSKYEEKWMTESREKSQLEETWREKSQLIEKLQIELQETQIKLYEKQTPIEHLEKQQKSPDTTKTDQSALTEPAELLERQQLELIEKLRNELQEKSELIKQLEIKLQETENSKSDQHGNSEQTKSTQQSKLEETLQSELNEKSNLIRNLQNELQEMTKVVEKSQNDLQLKSKLVEKLKIKLQGKQKSQENANLDESKLIVNTQNISETKLPTEGSENWEARLQNMTEAEQSELIETLQIELQDKFKLLRTLQPSKSNKNSQSDVQDLIIKQQLESIEKLRDDLQEKSKLIKKLKVKLQEVMKKNQMDEEKSKLQQELLEKTQLVEHLQTALQTTTQLLENSKHDLQEKSETLKNLETELQEKSGKAIHVAELERKNTDLTNEILTYTAQIEDLQNITREYENQVARLSHELETLRSDANNTSNLELSRKDEVITEMTAQLETLTSQIALVEHNAKINSDALHMKINELGIYIESQDLELNRYKEKVEKLEEGLSNVEERRKSLENQTIRLGVELREKDENFEKYAQNEDYLEERLKALAERDAAIETSLKETITENQNLTSHNQNLLVQLEAIKKQLEIAERKLHDTSSDVEKFDALESQNSQLHHTLSTVENELKKANSELRNLKYERERNESELQEQLEQYSIERKLLMEQCELSSEQVNALTHTRDELTSEISDLTQKLDQQQLDFEENILKYDRLESQHKGKLSELEELNDKFLQLQEGSKKLESPETVAELNQTISILRDELECKRNELLVLHQQVKFLEEQRDKQVISVSTKHACPQQMAQSLQHVRNENSAVFTWTDSGDSTDFILASQDKTLQPLSQHQQICDDNRQRHPTMHNDNPFVEHHEKDNVIGKQNISHSAQINNAEQRSVQDFFVEDQTKYDSTKAFFAENQSDSAQGYFANHQQVVDQVLGTPTQEAVIPQNIEQHAEESSRKISDLEHSTHQYRNLQHVTLDNAQPVMNSMEELKEKIKTLQFMLFNAEKERDTALQQCHQLSDQVAQLVYERLESQITVEESTSDQSPTVKVKRVDLASSPKDAPVEEPMIQARKTFVCYKDEDIFGENEGWGAEEATSTGTNQNMNILEEKIRVLELERQNHVEELKQAQIKSGKLIKKLKEFKLKNEQLSSKLKSDDCGDLNEAIQDELKSQICALEKRLKENNVEMEKEKHEKENLLKRIDVLTSANDRMIEMKEKQDIELLSWQHRNRDLTLKLEQLEWGDEKILEEKKVVKLETTSSNQELLETIKELTLDNEDLQALLEEQRNLRIQAERAKTTQVIPENVKTEFEYNQVVAERNALQEKIEQLEKYSLDNREIEESIIKKSLEKTEKEQRELLEQLDLVISEKEKIHTDLTQTKDQLKLIQIEHAHLQEKVKETTQQLQTNYSEKTQLEATILENNINIESLNRQLFEFQNENSKLQYESLENERLNLAANNEKLESQISNVQTELEASIDKINTLQMELECCKRERVQVTAEKEQLVIVLEEFNVAKSFGEQMKLENEQLTTSLRQLEMEKYNLEQKMRERVELMASLEEHKRENDRIVSDIESLKGEVVQQKALSQFFGDAPTFDLGPQQQLETKGDQLQASMEKLKLENEHLAASLEQLNLELERLKLENARLEELMAEKSSPSKHFDVENSSIEQLKLQNHELAASLEQFKLKLEQVELEKARSSSDKLFKDEAHLLGLDHELIPPLEQLKQETSSAEESRLQKELRTLLEQLKREKSANRQEVAIPFFNSSTDPFNVEQSPFENSGLQKTSQELFAPHKAEPQDLQKNASNLQELFNQQSSSHQPIDLLEEVRLQNAPNELESSQGLTDHQKLDINSFHKLVQHKSNEILQLQNLLSSKETENLTLQKTLNTLEQEKQELQSLLDNKNSELNITIQQLTQEWSSHVDQRGYEVAESWKLHLESRENEFMQLEQQLRKDLLELESRCSLLVDENKELRKSVDDEIRNEVDRISNLQKDINAKELEISELINAQKIKQEEIESMQVDVSNYTRIISELNMKIQELEGNEITVLKEKGDLERELLLARDTLKNAALEKDNKEHKAEHNLEIVQYEVEEELLAKDRVIERMQEEINMLKSSMEKESDLERLINKLQIDVKERENDLQENKLYLEDARHQINQFKLRTSNLEVSLKEKDHTINELNAIIEESQTNILQLQQQISELQQQISSYSVQLQENHIITGTIMQELENYKSVTEHVQSKDAEITRVNNLLQEKEREHAYELETKTLELQSIITDLRQQLDTVNRKLQEYEINHAETLNNTKVMEELYKNQIDEFVNTHKTQETEYIHALQQDGATKDAQLSELQNVVHDDEKQLLELKSIIEEQVIKIEELKQELFNKSNNYDALVAQLDIPHDLQGPSGQGDNVSESATRAELDLALYMLHQRDVRCEELTVELVQLLEERDTLQLRLSNALREKEELKARLDKFEDDVPELEVERKVVGSSGAVPKSKAIILGATGTELAAEATEHLTDGSLANKLSELKSVGYRKDKTIVDEQALRRIQQLSILQEHKDEVSKLPPEAAARLLDASYTLSRDVQSPSKVLLNWLWGRSTPKVNNV